MDQIVLSVRMKGDKEGPQTGDVVLENSTVSKWVPYESYKKDSVFTYGDQLWRATESFTAGAFFNTDHCTQLGKADAVLRNFQPNTIVEKDNIITNDDKLYRAKNSFTTGETFNVADWDLIGGDDYTFQSADGTVDVTVSSSGKIIDFSVAGSAVWEKGIGEGSAQQKGTGAVAKGLYSSAEGELSRVTIVDGAVERYNDGRGAHAEGGSTTAAGSYSHAEGNSTITNNAYEHAEGHFNVSNYTAATYPNAGNTIHSIGIGTNLTNRKNAVEVMQNGDAYVLGVGDYDGTNTSTADTIQEVIGDHDNRLTTAEDSLTQEITNRTTGDTAIENKINQVVVTDFSLNNTPSTTSIVLDGAKKNLSTGSTSTSSITLPVASASQAGVMNTSIYNAVQDNAQKINAILNGAVAITGLPASPTQQQLTTAWQTATGLTTLINDARIFDNTNQKNWNYFDNTSTWYPTDASGSTTVSTATNTSLGIVKGDATTSGKVFVEADGTMSLNGWDDISDDVADNTANITSLQTGKVDKVTGKQLSTEDYTTVEKTKLGGIEAGAEVNDPNTVIDASYVHTDNNYTTTEKTKLAGIEAGAEVNDPNTVIDADYVHTDNNYTTTEKTKLTGIEAGAEVNVQSDWNQNDSSAKNFVKNKPTLGSLAAKNTVTVSDVTWSGFLNKIYPVGSIYMSVTHSTAAQVNSALGGTWSAWGKGRVPVGVDTSQAGFNTVEKTGGEVTHKLTISEMPKHNHAVEVGIDNQQTGQFIPTSTTTKQWDYTHLTNAAISTHVTGSDTAHNNLQPYITCYFYKRTA